eukprot:gnl/TRDRNA2_/TRDRNA2_186727_c0_seq1.p1 gnl/TRDRNA2_/TRDRNA2_186727_c0~~gnl/TRDRNA2_/TRDRNA2_186727_c0_seq1.p1  ORF type:complete len:370 (-),score=49.37 gnl/TRDRNA2_/TRDRNA2_186727_c0_seq1:42-1151(-)
MDKGSVRSDIQASAKALALCIMYIGISTTLILSNKFLVNKHRFPHPMVLCLFHTTTTCVLANIFYLVKPSMFPTMERAKERKMQMFKYFVPLAILFATALFCSNAAYLYCSATFLQFMKEAHLPLIYCMSCCVGLTSWSRSKSVMIIWIVAGATMAVEGEVKFRLTGFLLQVIASLADCSRNVTGDWLMNESDAKLDPLTYTLFMMPACLPIISIGCAVAWDEHTMPDLKEWWPWLIPNAFLAFALNITQNTLIKHSSAVTFILAGIIKDICLVLVCAGLFDERVRLLQYIGFVVSITGVFFWSYSKLNPKSEVVEYFNSFWEEPESTSMEKAKLLNDPIVADDKMSTVSTRTGSASVSARSENFSEGA